LTEENISKTKQLLEKMEMNTPRKIVEKTILNSVTNQDITQQCGIRPIGELIFKTTKGMG
jgi:hypothetical protein